jgi:hypothetical protein
LCTLFFKTPHHHSIQFFKKNHLTTSYCNKRNPQASESQTISKNHLATLYERKLQTLILSEKKKKDNAKAYQNLRDNEQGNAKCTFFSKVLHFHKPQLSSLITR